MTRTGDDIQEGPQGNVAYQRLLVEIRAGRLLPGDRLREIDLAEQLGVSRTPVREAIRQLEADGLVTHRPRQGATVRSLDYGEVVELYEMRAVLEGTAARMAARVASDLELDELAALNAELAASKTSEEAAHLNWLFHAMLLDIARNRFLLKSMQSLQKSLMILGRTTLSEGARTDQAAAEHEAILGAIKGRDGDAAELAMRKHIESSQRVRLRALRDGATSIDEAT